MTSFFAFFMCKMLKVYQNQRINIYETWFSTGFFHSKCGKLLSEFFMKYLSENYNPATRGAY